MLNPSYEFHTRDVWFTHKFQGILGLAEDENKRADHSTPGSVREM